MSVTAFPPCVLTANPPEALMYLACEQRARARTRTQDLNCECQDLEWRCACSTVRCRTPSDTFKEGGSICRSVSSLRERLEMA